MRDYTTDVNGIDGLMPDGLDPYLSLERISLEIGKLPKLMIVGIDDLLLHEEPDERRVESVRRRITADGFLKHPLIAALDHVASSHLLLDGVNRFEALRRLGARFVPIQEVDLDDERLVLSTWHHAVEGLDVSHMVGDLPAPASVTPFGGDFTQTGDFVPRFSEDRSCCIALPDGRSYAICANGATRGKVETIRHVVRQIGSLGTSDRVSYTNMRDLARNYPRFSALVCYRGFTKGDVLRMSVEGVKFPSGITRFSVPKRALSFGVPLLLLMGEGSLEERQAAIRKMIIERIRARKIRFYEEPTFYFDD